jgi:hypothetical protein
MRLNWKATLLERAISVSGPDLDPHREVSVVPGVRQPVAFSSGFYGHKPGPWRWQDGRFIPCGFPQSGSSVRRNPGSPRRGFFAIEYTLIEALVAVAAIAAFTFLGPHTLQ